MDPQRVPPEVEQRLRTWKCWWRVFLYGHYSLGIIGVLSSTLAAALPKSGDVLIPHVVPINAASFCAVISACCFAVIGFVSPDRRYIGLVRAWRTLSVGLARYRSKLITEAQLLDLLECCEAVATEPSRHELPFGNLNSRDREQAK